MDPQGQHGQVDERGGGPGRADAPRGGDGVQVPREVHVVVEASDSDYPGREPAYLPW